MKKENENTFTQSKTSGRPLRRRLAHIFMAQLLCQCLMWQQLGFTPSVRAQETVAPLTTAEATGDSAATTVEQYDAIQAENYNSQSGSTYSNCRGERTVYDSYTANQASFTNYATQLETDISQVVANAGDELSNLLGAQAAFYETDAGFVNPTGEIKDTFDAKKKRWLDAQDGLVIAENNLAVAKKELSVAQSHCDDDHEHCSSDEIARIQAAQVNVSKATNEYKAALVEYKAAKKAYQNSPKDGVQDSENAVNATSGNANAMTGSHSISGCGSNFDITTNTDETCALSGPLFEKDNALTEIVNRNVNDAKALAAAREQALFELELEQKFDADYKLYKLAVDNATGEVQGKDVNGDGDFDDTELGEYTTKNQVSAALELSNMNTMSLASAAVRNMVCEKHDISEADPQSYYLFRAAMATWLTAVVNDTDYYNEESSCMATEEITSDKNNEQIQAIERAANLTERQLKSLCLRTRPSASDVIDTTDPNFLDDSNPEGWRRFNINAGGTEASRNETIRYVNGINKVILGYTDSDTGVTYPPLDQRCDEYLQEIIGDTYDPDAPRTREYAVEMITDALGVAVQELATKREKLAIAHANVEKGKQWVARVKRDLLIMAALAATVYAMYKIAIAQCAWAPSPGPMCPMAGPLKSKWVWITGTVIGVWLLTELARAQSFLAKWKKKREIAKYFSHMACNFEDAHEEQEEIEALGEEYSQKRKLAMQNASNSVINRFNHILYEEISGNTVEKKETTHFKEIKEAIDKVNKRIVHVKSVKELREDLSLIFFKEKTRWPDVVTLFKGLGVRILVNTLPGDEAVAAEVNQEEVYNTTNSLNIQTGTGNFKYFLTQRNQQFQNITNDITNQPEHTAADSHIANSGVKNVAKKVILTVDDLAEPFLGGDGHDPLEDIDPSKYDNPELTDYDKKILMKTGMATPETRVVTMENALALLTDNLTQLSYSTAVAGYNLDQYVNLLDTTRRELEIEDTGLGNTPAEQVVSPINACLAESTSELYNADPMCTCREANSCASFAFPTFNVEVPEALRNSGDSAIKTANNIASGNLEGAKVSGGTLMNNAGRVRDLINKNNEKGKKGNKNSNGNAGDLTRASSNKINGTLSKIGDNPNSTFNNLRRSLANKGLGGNALGSSSNSASTQNTQNDANKANLNAAVAGTQASGGKGRTAGATGADAKTTESFSLGGGNSNLDLSELSDEEKRRLGLLGDGLTNTDVVAIDRNGANGHRRNLSKSGKSGSLTNSRGINSNRKKSLFTIISDRYEKTAFPVLLEKKALK